MLPISNLEKVRSRCLSVALEHGFEAFACFSADHRFYLIGPEVLLVSVCLFTCVFTQLTSYEEAVLPVKECLMNSLLKYLAYPKNTREISITVLGFSLDRHHCATEGCLFAMN